MTHLTTPVPPSRLRQAPPSPLRQVRLLLAGLLLAFGLAAGQAALAAKPAAEPYPATVNVNAADAEQLSTRLDGVGTSRAKAIVAYRERHGKFSTLEDLLAVRGIGEKVLNANRKRIKFSEK